MKISWKPNPGQQTKFLAAGDYEVLFGGAAAAGKTHALLGCPLRFVSEPDHHAIIFRRTYPEIEEMVAESQALYKQLGARWIASKRVWLFPSGAKIRFGNLEDARDAYRYHGYQFTMLCFDELASWPTDEGYIYLQSRLRRKKGSKCRLQIRATCNPTGPGKAWVMRRFQIPPEGTATRIVDRKNKQVRRFIPGRITDNPKLEGDEYAKTLDALPPAKRAALRDGRWDSMEGQFFSHRPIAEFEAQPHWRYYAGFDFGRTHRTAFVLVGVDDDGHQWIVDLHSRAKTPIPIHAVYMRAMLAKYGLKPNELVSIEAGHDCWTTRDPVGTIAETYAKEGFNFARANIARVTGWTKMLDLFGDPEYGIESRATIHPRCRFLTDALMVLQHDPKRPEDVQKLDLPTNDPDGTSDDEADALRYCLMKSAATRATLTKISF